jgi:hypothetical protein
MFFNLIVEPSTTPTHRHQAPLPCACSCLVPRRKVATIRPRHLHNPSDRPHPAGTGCPVSSRVFVGRRCKRSAFTGLAEVAGLDLEPIPVT